MLVQGAGLTTGGLRNTAMETALDQFSAMVGERARTRQGKLSQGTGLQCWCGQGAEVQGAAKQRQCRARLSSGSAGRGWWRQGLATGGSRGGGGGGGKGYRT